MSKVAIKGNASGTGTFTLEAPNSNTDRTLTLPDEAGTVLTSGTPLSSFPSGFANGITEADQFYLTANRSGDGDITANLDRTDFKGFSKSGTGMSESSGIFSFPVTGLYLVQAKGQFNISGSDTVILNTMVTTNNSTYDQVAEAVTEHITASDANADCSSFYYVNVTDTSNVKVKFNLASMGGSSFLGGRTDKVSTSFTFIRLGDSQ